MPGMAGKKTAPFKIDFTTVGGIALAIGGIVGGLLLEGGKLQDVAQVTAGLIVLSGTFGAVMVSTPFKTLKGAMGRFMHLFREESDNARPLIEEIIEYATKARKNGLVSLEGDALAADHPFLAKALSLAVDGTDMQELRNMMELEIELSESRAHAEAKVFESAGGYAPTIGIIGAVMGLIQVMKNLANIEEVGHGIAVAFVATVYGVGIANIILIPAATKIRSRIQREAEVKQLMLEGVIAILEGLNPKLIRTKLEAFLEPERATLKKKTKDAAVPDAATALG